jgi:flagellar export protein FliJ
LSSQKYRLQPVLDKREKKKKDAEKILADARAEVERQKQILKQREEDIEKAVQKKDKYTADLRTKMDAGMETGKITAGKAFIEVLKQNIVTAQEKAEEQRKVVESAEQKVQAAVAGVAEATKEMKVIEKHKENWQDVVRKEIEEKEDKEQEEVAQSMYEQHRKR